MSHSKRVWSSPSKNDPFKAQGLWTSFENAGVFLSENMFFLRKKALSIVPQWHDIPFSCTAISRWYWGMILHLAKLPKAAKVHYWVPSEIFIHDRGKFVDHFTFVCSTGRSKVLGRRRECAPKADRKSDPLKGNVCLSTWRVEMQFLKWVTTPGVCVCVFFFSSGNYLLLYYMYSSNNHCCKSLLYIDWQVKLCPLLAFTALAQTLWWVRQCERRTIIIFSQITVSRCQSPHVEAVNWCLQINSGIILQASESLCVCWGRNEGLCHTLGCVCLKRD